MPSNCTEVNTVTSHLHEHSEDQDLFPCSNISVNNMYIFYFTFLVLDHICCRANRGSGIIGCELCTIYYCNCRYHVPVLKMLLQWRAEQIKTANRWEIRMGPQRICWKSLIQQQTTKATPFWKTGCLAVCLSFGTLHKRLTHSRVMFVFYLRLFFLWMDYLLVPSIIIIPSDILFYWEGLFNSVRVLRQCCVLLSVFDLFRIRILIKCPISHNYPISIQPVRSSLSWQ